MLYTSLSQPAVFLYMFIAGIFCGVVISCSKCFGKKLYKHNFLKQFNYAICIIVCFLLFLSLNLLVNYGQIRFFVFFASLIGIIIEQIFLEKIWTNFMKKCYNLINGRKKNKKEKIQ